MTRSRLRATLVRQAAFLAVLLGVAVGLGLVLSSRPTRGALVAGGSLVGAAVLRVGLSERYAGLLVNRGKVLDAATLGALGGAIIVLTLSLRATYIDL